MDYKSWQDARKLQGKLVYNSWQLQEDGRKMAFQPAALFALAALAGPLASVKMLSMSSQTRSSLSLLHSVTFLRLQKTHFVSFSEFARTVCALPNLFTLELWNVTIDTSRSYSLNGVYFARALHLKHLQIHNCAFNESHPIWNLLTAPSLSDSLVTIDVLSAVKDLDPALRRLPVPPALLLSANLGQLTRMHFDLWTLSCEGGRDVAVSHLLSRSPVNYITSIEISYRCDHSSPHLNEWGLLFVALDDAISATNFSVLKTVTVSFKTTHPFDFDYVRAAMDSQSYSAKWEKMFTMSSVTFIPADLDGTSSSSQRVFMEREISADQHPEGLNLAIRFGDVLSFKYKATVVYTRRPCS
ncbi:hypothetical protein CERSUDRAFT_89802 [Gelatoporia subvermispora B]|uniref:Uncharacterized protein n=1 Tax=Ceriporiopsis subvermispora (strain B) TaxID=914234 RepID=M2RS12_CERS8|nr:hypothetical protein CERSUDRAFT_89802 [Gelatoporia subvermispora B]